MLDSGKSVEFIYIGCSILGISNGLESSQIFGAIIGLDSAEVLKSLLSLGLGSGVKFSDASSQLSGETNSGSDGITSVLTGSMLSFFGKNGNTSG